VRPQQFRHAIRAELRAPEHRVEKRGHRVGIETRGRERADSDPVGFLFVLARKVDLSLCGHALGGHHTAHRRVRAGAAGGAHQDRREHRGG
jgi:hypothetical protein